MNKLDERGWKRHDESVEFVRRLSKMTNINYLFHRKKSGSMLLETVKRVKDSNMLVVMI